MTITSLAPFVSIANTSNSNAFVGHLASRLATAAETGGQLSVYEVTIRKDATPPPHTHSLEDEAFFVLAGRFRFLQGASWRDAPTGSFVWLPRGVPHAFEVDADGARALVMCFPGGHLEQMFEPPYSSPVTSMALPNPPADPAVYDALAELDARLGVVYS